MRKGLPLPTTFYPIKPKSFQSILECSTLKYQPVNQGRQTSEENSNMRKERKENNNLKEQTMQREENLMKQTEKNFP